MLPHASLGASQLLKPARAPLSAEVDVCSICLDPLSLIAAASLPCGHVFHPACAEGLRVCLMCRIAFVRAQCGVAASNLKACGRCGDAAYCSRECQIAHWKRGHKKKCVLPSKIN